MADQFRKKYLNIPFRYRDMGDGSWAEVVYDAASAAPPAGGATEAKQDAQIVQETSSATSLAIIDDWDESDRAKVNLIVGQAGIASGAGVVGATVPRVTIASDSPRAIRGTITDRSGTITSGGTAQQLMASNANRSYLFIQNISDIDLWFNFTTTAVAAQPSIRLVPGASFVLEGTFVSTELISIFGATTSKAFTAKEA